MDVKTLYTLIAITDRGSFAKAGQSLGLSLPAVSMQIKALEDELGFTIFDRTRRPSVLTDRGLALIHRARDLITRWESMSEALKKDATGGLLKLGSVHTCVSGVLPPALKRMQECGHRIDIHLTTGLTHDLERAVRHRQLDVAVVTEPAGLIDGLDFHFFAEEPLAVVTHKSNKEQLDKAVLEATPYVRFNRSARVGALIQEEIARREITVRSIMEIDNLEGVIAMVANGLGSSVVPTRGVKDEFPASIKVIPFGSPPLTRRLGLLVPRDNPRSHLSQVLLEALIAVSSDSDNEARATIPATKQNRGTN